MQNYIESLDKAGKPVLSINIDKGFVQRMVLSLSLDCHASMEGIQRNFASVSGLHLSYGKISSILAEASERAEQFDAGILLDSIKQGANDEIFQANTLLLQGSMQNPRMYIFFQRLATAALTHGSFSWKSAKDAACHWM